MDLPEGAKYSFPVLTGFSDAEPLSTRAPRMKIFSALMRDLDSGGKGYSLDISDVDLTDPKDVKITAAQGTVLIHAVSKNFLEQYQKYLEVVSQCRARFGTAKLDVDARFVGQVPCKPIAETAPLAAQTAPATQEIVQPETPASVAAVKPASKPVAKHGRAQKGRKH
jgi:cell division protein FtsQ